MEYTKERLHELELAERKLNALEAAGVDNWTYYDDALKDIRNEEDNKMKKDQLLIDLETDFWVKRFNLLNKIKMKQQILSFIKELKNEQDKGVTVMDIENVILFLELVLAVDEFI